MVAAIIALIIGLCIIIDLVRHLLDGTSIFLP
jgi:hypothetical protein